MKPKYQIVRQPAPSWVGPLLPILAVLVTFIITGIFLLMSHANPLEAIYYIMVSPLTSRVSALEVLVKATPLLLTGAAVTIAFASGYYNIGAEGQLYAGAMAAAWLGMIMGNLPPVLAIPLMLLGGFAAGMLWALIPALLKVKLSVDEVVTTLLMNSIIMFIVSAMLNGPWRDPASGWPQSAEIAASTELPRLFAGSRLHLGFIVALVMIALVWFILSRTSLGLRMRAVGLGKDAAKFMGVNVPRTTFITALLSGGIAGLAGVTEVAGIHFHLIDAISNGFGYTGIIAATLGGLNPIGSGVAAIFLGLIDTGSQSVSRAMGVSTYLGDVVQAVLLLVMLAVFLLKNYQIRRVE
ncbi:MAG TPA: ABC transporter permease [Longilinea sp.]|nr:ABC transporter permease [Longilinea sp.]